MLLLNTTLKPSSLVYCRGIVYVLTKYGLITPSPHPHKPAILYKKNGRLRKKNGG